MTRLGKGGDGPWENRTHLYERGNFDPEDKPFLSRCVAGHLNAEHSVQRAQHPEHPGVDHLIVRRHDGAHIHPGWRALQEIKDRLAPDGTERFGLEIFPPRRLVIDNHPLYHVWVMPLGWEPPGGLGLHSEQEGNVPT